MKKGGIKQRKIKQEKQKGRKIQVKRQANKIG